MQYDIRITDYDKMKELCKMKTQVCIKRRTPQRQKNRSTILRTIPPPTTAERNFITPQTCHSPCRAPLNVKRLELVRGISKLLIEHSPSSLNPLHRTLCYLRKKKEKKEKKTKSNVGPFSATEERKK